MNHFRINVRTPLVISESIKLEKRNHTELMREVARYSGELLLRQADEFWRDEEWQVEVTDDFGLILYVINITASRAESDHSGSYPVAVK